MHVWIFLGRTWPNSLVIGIGACGSSSRGVHQPLLQFWQIIKEVSKLLKEESTIFCIYNRGHGEGLK